MKYLYLVLLLSLSFVVVNGQGQSQQPRQQHVIRTDTETVQTAVTVFISMSDGFFAGSTASQVADFIVR